MQTFYKYPWAGSRLLQQLLQMLCRRGRNKEPGHGSYSNSCKRYARREGTVSQVTAPKVYLLQLLCLRGRSSEPGHGSYSTSCKCYAWGEGTVSQVTAPTAPPANVMQEGKGQWARSRLLHNLRKMLSRRGRDSELGHGAYITSCRCYARREGTVSQVTAPTVPPANAMLEGKEQWARSRLAHHLLQMLCRRGMNS